MKRSRTKDANGAAAGPKGGFRQSDRARIPEVALTFRESRVLETLRASERPLTVRELARRCFPGLRARLGTYESTRADGRAVRHATAKAYRCVLNSLRRLVVGQFAVKVDRGTYAAANRAVDSKTERR